MKKVISIPTISMLLASPASAQLQKTDWVREELKSKVFTISETYKSLKNPGEIQNGKKDSTVIIFNNKGNKIEESNYYADERTVSFRNFIKYDDKGYKIEKNGYSLTRGIVNKDTYVYDTKGNLILENFVQDGKFQSSTTYNYDDKGNIIEYNVLSSNGGLLIKITNKYDNKGNAIENNRYKSGGNLDYKSINKFDDKGMLIESNIYDPDGSLRTKFTYKYDFDKNLNWIKKTEFKNEVQTSITERVIVYF